ncbi:MAG: hypothetical protein ACJ75I_11330 [Solirubrobacterales bacterium]
MSSTAVQTRRVTIAALALIALALAILANSDRAAAATRCPNAFSVLHNDHVGKLSLRKGSYTITVTNQNKLSCQRAASLFTTFLQDFDGNLPDGWRVSVRRSGFIKNPRKSFFVKRTGPGGGGDGGGGRHPARGEMICPGTFQVQHHDHIGRLDLPKGPYTITVIKKRRISCQRASNLFARFLQIPSGHLPGGWRLKAPSGEFLKRHKGYGFRVKQA